MPSDLQSIADPQLIVLAWAAGLAVVAGVISTTGIVGRGFIWLAGGVSMLLTLPGAFAEGGWQARTALALIVVAVVGAGVGSLAGGALTVAGVLLAIQASIASGPVPTLTATLALGGVTGEMMLGHWYLVDPRLPRLALRVMALAGIVGLGADGMTLASAGLPDGGATIAYWALLSTSIILMIAVIGALRYPAYSGVMASTGLSYLAVLTTLGAVFVGRALVAGLGPLVT